MAIDLLALQPHKGFSDLKWLYYIYLQQVRQDYSCLTDGKASY